MGFCICSKVDLQSIEVQDIMAYLEYLVQNSVSGNILANNVSAIKAHFVMAGLSFQIWYHPRVKYFVKINRPLCPVHQNIMSLNTLKKFVQACCIHPSPHIFKAIFLMAFFGFLRISNLAPHSYAQFDLSRHLTPADITFKKSTILVQLKWSKTMQTCDKIHTIVLPKLGPSILCPVSALKNALAVYHPNPHDPLFQIDTQLGFKVITESRLRKSLTHLNVKMGLQFLKVRPNDGTK